MKKFQTLYILILLLCAGFNGVYAQQQTTYEKKKAELLVQAWAKFGQDGLRGRTYIFDKSDKDVYKEAEAVEEASLLLGRYTISMQFIKWYANELKKIEKLKSAIDFQLENEKKTQEIEAAYEKTDKGSITKNIKSEFEKWNQKGEFEKEGDYEERLKIQSQKTFSQICIEQIRSKIDNYHADYDMKRELATYDSENESFTVSFKINGVEWQNILKIPIADAPNFKNNWDRMKCKVSNYDWCFVENSLCPTLITLYNSTTKYEFPLVLNNQSAITYSFDNFEITNPYLKGNVFNYSNAKIIDKQIHVAYCTRLDSIFKDSNRQLIQNPYNVSGKVLTGYDQMESEGNQEDNFNKSLSVIKSTFERLYNSFGKELESAKPIEYCRIYYAQNPDKKTEADRMYLECRCNYPQREKFDIKFISRNLYSCNCRESEYRKNGKLFTSKGEFDTFYDKEDSIYQIEIEKRTILNFINANSKFVESMDFQKEKKESYGSSLGRGLLGAAMGTDISEKDYSNENEIRKTLLSLINDSKEKPSYSQIIDLLIETNKDLNKECLKNGKLFDNKVKFYEAYISGNYKQILKEKKQ